MQLRNPILLFAALSAFSAIATATWPQSETPREQANQTATAVTTPRQKPGNEKEPEDSASCNIFNPTCIPEIPSNPDGSLTASQPNTFDVDELDLQDPDVVERYFLRAWEPSFPHHTI